MTGRVDRVDVGRGGEAIVRDYKGRSVVGGGKWADELQLQVALYLLAVRELLGLEPVAGLYQPLAGRGWARAGWCAKTSPAATRGPTRRRRRLRRRAGERARARRAHRRRPARRTHPALPRALLEPWLPPPGDLPRGRAASGGAGVIVTTREQRAAIADRDRSSLLAAGAGSGKTAVMVERFAEAVLHDELAVGSILTLTFTEKAAAELRERIRRRFLELGEPEHARAVDAAWIGTIHGFCARVLRSQPLAAGLDPRFVVLDEAAARRLARRRSRPRWRSGSPRAARPPSISRPPTGASSSRWSRGRTPRCAAAARRGPGSACRRGSRARRRAAAAAAARAAAALRARPRNGARVTAALEALEACERLVAAAADPPLPGALDDARLPAGAKALEHDDCAAYREDWEAYRAACADHHARPALVLIDELLGAFRHGVCGCEGGPRGRRLRGPRAGRPRPLHGRRRPARALGGALRADHGRRVPGHEPAPARLLEALERDSSASANGGGNLFAVGDESQSIYGFRHADVGIFRARRAALGHDGVRGLTVNFRSRPEILDVVNAAFAPLLGAGFTPLVAGRAPDELRLFAPDPPEEPRVELLVCETTGWEEREAELGLAGLANQPWRRAEARAVAARLRAEVDDAGRP